MHAAGVHLVLARHDPATINPATVTVSRDPCGRWYVSLAVDAPDPKPLLAAGRDVGSRISR
jgi:putative transposase